MNDKTDTTRTPDTQTAQEAKKPKNRRAWVKNVLIIFLAVLCVLTFFSNTIFHYSHPEVSVQRIYGDSITTNIRGSGTIEANQLYEVKLEGTRTVSDVFINVDDEIEAGQLIFSFSGGESDELVAAQEMLDTLRLNYSKKLLGIVPNDYYDQNRSIEDAQLALDDANLIKASVAVNHQAYLQAQQATKNAQAAVDVVDKRITEINDQITAITEDPSQVDVELVKEWQATLVDAEARLERAKLLLEDAKTSESTRVAYATAVQEYEAARYTEELTRLQYEYCKVRNEGGDTTDTEQALTDKWYPVPDATENVTEYENNTAKNNLAVKEAAYEKAKRDYEAAGEVISSVDAQDNVNYWTRQVENVQKELDNITKDATKVLTDELRAQTLTKRTADEALTAAKAAEETAKEEGSTTEAEADKQVRDAQRALEDLLYNLAKEQSSDELQQQLTNLDLQADRKAIEKQADLVSELTTQSQGSELTARFGGRVTSVNASPGTSVPPGTVLAVIEVSERGYTVSFTVTAAQGQRLRAGDVGTVSGLWYGYEATATLLSTKVDPSSQGRSVIVTFLIEGDLQVGQTVNITVGERSTYYEMVVPNSSVYEDSEGSFILTVEVRSSPIGNRYVARRTPVTVITQDATSTAISADLYGGEYVITASTKPIQDGDLVRYD